MVRRLLLLRHAKSSWADPGVRDHDRPLNDRGRRAARSMGEHLRDEGLLPELVLCSSARRTCDTVAGLGLPDDVALVVTRDLYLAAPDTVVDLVREVDDAVRTLMVVGHNPTTHEVALTLAGGGDPDALDRLGRQYPTAALTVLAFGGSWADVAEGAGHLDRFVVPRELE